MIVIFASTHDSLREDNVAISWSLVRAEENGSTGWWWWCKNNLVGHLFSVTGLWTCKLHPFILSLQLTRAGTQLQLNYRCTLCEWAYIYISCVYSDAHSPGSVRLLGLLRIGATSGSSPSSIMSSDCCCWPTSLCLGLWGGMATGWRSSSPSMPTVVSSTRGSALVEVVLLDASDSAALIPESEMGDLAPDWASGETSALRLLSESNLPSWEPSRSRPILCTEWRFCWTEIRARTCMYTGGWMSRFEDRKG